ncbi:MAG: hypothetical protein FWG68_05570, partial [Defluviitaleaceae bacterium]|nr:hypothetical protein [Defluviitaleaceae bacterium]
MRKKGILQILAGGILAIIAVILTIYGNVPNLPAVQPPPLSAAQPQISQTSLNFTSNAFTQYRQPLQTLQSPNPALGDFTLAAENQFLRLFVQPNSLAIKVQNVQ